MVGASKHRRRIALLLAVGGLVGFALGAVGRAAPDFEQAESGEATYRVSNLTLRTPSNGLSDFEVTFDYQWSGASYPGPAECRLTLTAADGTVAGLVRMHLDSLEPTASAVLPVTSMVGIDGIPASATAECAASDTPDAVARYMLTDLRIVGPNEFGVVDLLATADWTGDGEPDTQQCTLSVQLSTGALASYSFTLSASDGQVIELSLPDEFLGALDPEALCGPYVGPQDEGR